MLDLIKFCRQQTGYLQTVSFIENNEFPLVQTGQQAKAQTCHKMKVKLMMFHNLTSKKW